MASELLDEPDRRFLRIRTIVHYPQVHAPGAVGLLPASRAQPIKVRVEVHSKDGKPAVPVDLWRANFDVERSCPGYTRGIGGDCSSLRYRHKEGCLRAKGRENGANGQKL